MGAGVVALVDAEEEDANDGRDGVEDEFEEDDVDR
jgi:hypothetical protein